MIGPLASLIVKTASGPKKPAKSATTFVSNKGDSPSPAMSAKKPTVKRTVVSSEKLLNLKPLEKRQQQLSKEKSNTGTPLDASFNTINESLASILSIISNTNTFKKEKVKDNQKKEAKQRKKIREAMLEGAGRARVAALSKLKGVSKPAFLDTIGNYFKNLLIGSLVLFVVNQYERIKKFVENIFAKIQELFDSLTPVLTPVWDSLKWIVGEGTKLIAPLVGFNTDTLQFDKDKINENLAKIDGFMKQIFTAIGGVVSFYNFLAGNPTGAYQPGGTATAPSRQQLVTQTERRSGMASFREDAAENQALQESVRGQTSPPRTGSSTASSLFGRISGGEGGVDSYNTGRADVQEGYEPPRPISQMTVDQVYAEQQKGVLFAVGKYQIVPATMKGFIDYLRGIGIDTSSAIFNESLQNKFEDYTLASKRKLVGKFIKGDASVSLETAQIELAAEFASIGVPRDMKRGEYSSYAPSLGGPVPRQDIKKGQSLYTGYGGNRSSITPDEIKDLLLQKRRGATEISSFPSYDNPYMNASVIVPLPQQQQVAQAQQGDTQVIPIFSSVNNDYGELFGNSLYKV